MRKITSFMGCLILLGILLSFASTKAESLGSYISIKMDTSSVGSKNIWFYKAGKEEDRIFSSIVAKEYQGKKCALFLTQENKLNFDYHRVLWVNNNIILGHNSSLNADLSGSYEACCIQNKKDVSYSACGITSYGNCDTLSSSNAYSVAKILNEPYAQSGDVFDYNCGNSSCQADSLVYSDSDLKKASYKLKSQILCYDGWHSCDKKQCVGSYACDGGGVWRACRNGQVCDSKLGECVTPVVSVVASQNPLNLTVGMEQKVIFTVKKGVDVVSDSTVTIWGYLESQLTPTAQQCKTNTSGQCDITFRALSVGRGVVQAEVKVGGITGGVQVSYAITNCPVGSEMKLKSGNVALNKDIVIQTTSKTNEVFKFLCVQDPSGVNKYSAALTASVASATEYIVWKDIAIKADVVGDWNVFFSPNGSCEIKNGVCQQIVQVAGEEVSTGILNCRNLEQCFEITDKFVGCQYAKYDPTQGPQTVITKTSSDDLNKWLCTNFSKKITVQRDSKEECELACGVSSSGEEVVPVAPKPSKQPVILANPLLVTVGNLFQGVEVLIKAILGFAGAIALLLLVISGAMYITSAGDEGKVQNAKKIITGTIFGLIIVLLSFSLLVLIEKILNGK